MTNSFQLKTICRVMKGREMETAKMRNGYAPRALPIVFCENNLPFWRPGVGPIRVQQASTAMPMPPG